MSCIRYKNKRMHLFAPVRPQTKCSSSIAKQPNAIFLPALEECARCCICQEISNGEVYECHRRIHMVCSKCFHNLNVRKCPFEDEHGVPCAQDMIPEPSPILSSILQSAKYPCCHSSCKKILDGRDAWWEHIKQCEFGLSIQCPDDNCEWGAALPPMGKDIFIQHCELAHGLPLSTGKHNVFHLVKYNPELGHKIGDRKLLGVFESHGQHFYIVADVISSEMVAMSCYILHDNPESFELQQTLSIEFIFKRPADPGEESNRFSQEIRMTNGIRSPYELDLTQRDNDHNKSTVFYFELEMIFGHTYDIYPIIFQVEERRPVLDSPRVTVETQIFDDNTSDDEKKTELDPVESEIFPDEENGESWENEPLQMQFFQQSSTKTEDELFAKCNLYLNNCTTVEPFISSETRIDSPIESAISKLYDESSTERVTEEPEVGSFATEEFYPL